MDQKRRKVRVDQKRRKVRVDQKRRKGRVGQKKSKGRVKDEDLTFDCGDAECGPGGKRLEPLLQVDEATGLTEQVHVLQWKSV